MADLTPVEQSDSKAPSPLAVLGPLTLPNHPPLLTAVKKELTYSWFGLFDLSTLSESVSSFVASNSDAATTTAAAASALSSAATAGDIDTTTPAPPTPPSPLKRVFTDFLSLSSQDCASTVHPAAQARITQACWLTVRMWKPTSQYVVPRWHRDGRMFPCSCTDPPSTSFAASSPTSSTNAAPLRPKPKGFNIPQRHHAKYAIALLGRPTRVLAQPNALVDSVLNEVLAAWRRGEIADEEEGRREEAERLRGQEEVVLEEGDVLRFSWGQEDSPVHSEPDCVGTDRVFVSVLYGTEEEIRAMAEFRGERFGVVDVE